MLVDPSIFDTKNVIADQAILRKYNPQRFEFEQLTAIVFDDIETNTIAGYKEISEREFWVRGAASSVMPSVLMCEAAGQLCSYHASIHGHTGGHALGLGGLREVVFGRSVRPPCRLDIAARMVASRTGKSVMYRFECFIGPTCVCEGKLLGIAFPKQFAEVPN